MNALTTEEVRAHFRGLGDSGLDDPEHTSWLEDEIETWSGFVAAMCGREDWGDSATSRTETHAGGQPHIIVGVPPIAAVSALTDNGTSIGSTSYELIEAEGMIRLKGGTFSASRDAVSVTYTGGYADEGSVPKRIKRAVLMFIEWDRETFRVGGRGERRKLTDVIAEAERLIDDYRLMGP